MRDIKQLQVGKVQLSKWKVGCLALTLAGIHLIARLLQQPYVAFPEWGIQKVQQKQTHVLKSIQLVFADAFTLKGVLNEIER